MVAMSGDSGSDNKGSGASTAPPVIVTMPGDDMDGEDGKDEGPSSAPGAPVYVGT
jgi:hypothetical protein